MINASPGSRRSTCAFPTCRTETRARYRLNNYFDKVSEFDGAKFADDIVPFNKITDRVLQLVVPNGSMTDAQRTVIETARGRARKLDRPVDLIITQF
jgi:hypothetical protein